MKRLEKRKCSGDRFYIVPSIDQQLSQREVPSLPHEIKTIPARWLRQTYPWIQCQTALVLTVAHFNSVTGVTNDIHCAK